MKNILSIFTSEETILDFLLDNNIVPREKECQCGSVMKITKQKRNSRDTVLYRCQIRNCLIRSNLLSSKLPLHIYLNAIYFIMSGASYWQINIWLCLSDDSIISVKHKIRRLYKKYILERVLLLSAPDILV